MKSLFSILSMIVLGSSLSSCASFPSSSTTYDSSASYDYDLGFEIQDDSRARAKIDEINKNYSEQSLSSSALFPPAVIVKNFYLNYEYDFGFELQDGWHESGITDEIKKEYGGPAQKMSDFQLTLINRFNSAVLFVQCERTLMDPDYFTFVDDKKLEELYKAASEIARKDMENSLIDNNGKLEKYSYTLNRLKCFDGPCLTAIVEVKYSVEDANYEAYTKVFNYRCHKKDFCSASFMIISPNGILEDVDIRSFNKMTSTIVKDVIPDTTEVLNNLKLQ